MQANTKFLPGFSTKLHGRQRRRQLESLRREREKARSQSIADFGTLFDFVLPLEVLRSAACDCRERTYPEPVTFWGWFAQIIGANASCGTAVAMVQAWFQENGLPIPSAGTSSFCRARARLSDDFLDHLSELCESHAEARAEPWQLWRGLRAKAIDGTSFRLDDTEENQSEYPQPSGQAPGCGFPVMSVVGVLDLATGRLLDSTSGPDRRHDARGLYQLLDSFGEGDVAVADRGFCGFELLGLLRNRGTHSVMRMHQAREGKLDWRRGRRVSANARLVVWKRPPKPGSCGITRDEWEQLPETMEIRLVRTCGKDRHGNPKTIYLATTLLDGEEYPAEEVAALYAERWRIEVKFRDIKTTLGLEHLRVKTPEMARKTLRMITLAYNLIKALQLEAASGSEVLPDEVAFRGAVAVVVESRARFRLLQNRPRLLAREMRFVHERILERVLRIRPGRSEPRASKRRPKCYQYLSSPRAEFREILHREHYRAIA